MTFPGCVQNLDLIVNIGSDFFCRVEGRWLAAPESGGNGNDGRGDEWPWGEMALGDGGTGERWWHGVVGRQLRCGITVGKVTLCQLGLVPSVNKKATKKNPKQPRRETIRLFFF